MTEQLPQQSKAPLMINQANRRGVVINSIDDAARLAQGFASSGMIPEAYKVKKNVRDDQGNIVEVVDWPSTTARVMIAIMKGIEVGLPPITSMEWIIPVNNRSCIWGDGALALIENSGLLELKQEYFEGDFKTDTWKAVCILKKKGRAEPVVREFTWKQAKDANLTTKGKAWPAYPGRMLQMRARSLAMRDEFSEVLQGLHIAEEQQDIVDSTPAQEVKKAAQQDEFTMAALSHQPAQSVDFSLMGDKKPEPVAVKTTMPEQPAMAMTAEGLKPLPETDAFGLPPVSQQDKQNVTVTISAAACSTCKGKGSIDFKEKNPDTGQMEEGIQPCPDC